MRPLLALGLHLARRGILAGAAMAISAATVLFVIVVAIVLGRRGPHAPVHDVPLLASSALAWGGGVLHAFATSAHALRNDRKDGVRDLLFTRTTSLRGYLVARVGGLAAMLALVVGGGTLLCGIVSALAAARLGAVPKTMQATFAALVFAVAFAAVLAPVAFAALGARSRVGGYFFLAGVIVLPELVATSLANVLPESVTEVLAIPSALAALRGALAPGGFDPLRAIRALVALAAFAGIAFFLVRRDAVRVAEEQES
ncbi:MAG TPA: hypothetical protein VIF62_25455 [Labilithrix sp.]|jgi:hypothetical protein